MNQPPTQGTVPPQNPYPAQPPTPVAGNVGYNPNQPVLPANDKLKSRIIKIIVGVVAFMSLGVLGFIAFSHFGSGFGDLEQRTGSNYTVEIPSDWKVEERFDSTLYFDGETSDQSTSLAVVASETVPQYSSMSDAEKDVLIDEFITVLRDESLSLFSEVPDLSGVTATQVSITDHSNFERAVVIEFAGQNQAGIDIEGEMYSLFSPDGGLYVLAVAARTPVWEQNTENFEAIVASLTPL